MPCPVFVMYSAVADAVSQDVGGAYVLASCFYGCDSPAYTPTHIHGSWCTITSHELRGWGLYAKLNLAAHAQADFGFIKWQLRQDKAVFGLCTLTPLACDLQ
jgi:hypothetical protein